MVQWFYQDKNHTKEYTSWLKLFEYFQDATILFVALLTSLLKYAIVDRA